MLVINEWYGRLGNNVLQETSCRRHDRAEELLLTKFPSTTEECFTILQDENVMMDMTVQQMVFNNYTGEFKLIKT